MKRFALLIAALTLTATAAFAAEGSFEKTLAVSSAPSLSVATGSGYVHVYSGSGSQVHVIGRVHVRAGLFGALRCGGPGQADRGRPAHQTVRQHYHHRRQPRRFLFLQ